MRVRCADCTVPSYSSLNMEKVYRVAMNSYMAGGGYGFSANQNKLSLIKGKVVNQLFQTINDFVSLIDLLMTIKFPTLFLKRTEQEVHRSLNCVTLRNRFHENGFMCSKNVVWLNIE